MASDIYQLETNNSPVVLCVNENKLFLSSSTYSSSQDMLNDAEMVSKKKLFTVIKGSNIHKMVFNEGDQTLLLKFSSEKSMHDSMKLNTKGQSEIENLLDTIAGITSLKKDDATESSGKKLTQNVLLFGVVLVIVAVAVYLSLGDVGEPATASRKARKGFFLVKILQELGPVVVGAIGGAIMGAIASVTFKRYKNPTREIKYTK